MTVHGLRPRPSTHLARQRDRDATSFFAGRRAELERFEDALEEAKTHPDAQAVLLIFQGAPGCGKTALPRRVEEPYADRALFVALENEHLSSRAELLDEIARIAAKRVSPGRKFVSLAAQGVVETLRASRTAENLGDCLRKGKSTISW